MSKLRTIFMVALTASIVVTVLCAYVCGAVEAIYAIANPVTLLQWLGMSMIGAFAVVLVGFMCVFYFFTLKTGFALLKMLTNQSDDDDSDDQDDQDDRSAPPPMETMGYQKTEEMPALTPNPRRASRFHSYQEDF